MSKVESSESQRCHQLPVHTVQQLHWDGFATVARLDREPDVDCCIRSTYLDLSRTLTGMATFPDAEAWYRFTLRSRRIG